MPNDQKMIIKRRSRFSVAGAAGVHLIADIPSFCGKALSTGSPEWYVERLHLRASVPCRMQGDIYRPMNECIPSSLMIVRVKDQHIAHRRLTNRADVTDMYYWQGSISQRLTVTACFRVYSLRTFRFRVLICSSLTPRGRLSTSLNAVSRFAAHVRFRDQKGHDTPSQNQVILHLQLAQLSPLSPSRAARDHIPTTRGFASLLIGRSFSCTLSPPTVSPRPPFHNLVPHHRQRCAWSPSVITNASLVSPPRVRAQGRPHAP